MLPKRSSLLSTFETRLDASMVMEHDDEDAIDDEFCVTRLKSISTSSGYGSSAESSVAQRESESSNGRTLDECLEDMPCEMKSPLCLTKSLDAPLVINTSAIQPSSSVYDTPFASPLVGDDAEVQPMALRTRRHTMCAKGDMNYGMVMVRNKSGPLAFQLIGELDSTQNIFVQYLRLTPCYDLASSHGAVVALDSSITIQRAFAIVLDAEPVECRVLVWDEPKHAYIGSLTLTDLIGALHHGGSNEDVLSKTLRWLIVCRASLPERHQPSHLVTAHTDSSIYDLIKLMRLHGIHRIVVCESKKTDRLTPLRHDTSASSMKSDKRSPSPDDLADIDYVVTEPVLCWLGWKRVLRCINGQLRMTNRWNLLNRAVRETRIGTWERETMVTVSRATPVRDAIALLVAYHLTAVPVVEDGVMVDVLTKKDIANSVVLMCKAKRKHSDATLGPAARKQSALLTVEEMSTLYASTVGALVEGRAEGRTLGSWTCTTTDTLRRVVDRLVAADRKCIFVVDERRVCQAVMSVSDIVTRLLDDSEHMTEQATARPRRMRVQSESVEPVTQQPRRVSMVSPVSNLYTRRASDAAARVRHSAASPSVP